MSNEHDPREPALTKEDFFSCGWETVLAKKTHKHYTSMFSAFKDAMEKADDEDRPAHGKVLWLLSIACSMCLSPKSLNEPFKPLMQSSEGRTPIPDDLSKSDIDFFAEIAGAIDDPWLRARLADLVWLKRRNKGGFPFVLMAIDAYREIPMDIRDMVSVGVWYECLERAIVLAQSIREGAGDRLAQIESSIIGTFESEGEGNELLCFNLADILKSHGLGKDRSTMIAQRLELLGREFEKKSSFHRAGQYFSASADWFNMSGDNAKSVEMRVEWAETYVKEAAARASSDDPSNLVAAHHYERAIQIYRSIPNSDRKEHQVDERIAELMALHGKANKKSLDEMAHISSDGEDISQFIENSRNAVKGKNLIEALLKFVNMYRGVDVEELRKRTTETLQDNPMLGLIPMSHMTRDGRVAAKQPAGSGFSFPSDDRVRYQMINNYTNIYVTSAVQAIIWPALEVLLLEHRLQEADFVNLAEQSPFVEMTGRERLLGKALYAGYDLNFATALHILVPQLEHMVRFHLKEGGVSTTNLNENGIETEIGLNSLMDRPETEEIFGKDLRFEIQALFCDPVGANLRNNVAHGLIGYEECHSPPAIYAWWLVLKIVFNTFWNARHSSPESDKPQEG